MNKETAIWKDTTSRSQGHEKAPQTVWTYENKHLRISVMNAHRFDPGHWIVNCFALGIDTERLGIPPESTPELAQYAALTKVRSKLTLMLNTLPEIKHPKE